MCIMLTMESTIMDMAMGVDETDCRNVVFLFGFRWMVDEEWAC